MDQASVREGCGNSVIMKAVEEWQANETIHPLTCGIDSNHRPLKAVGRDGKVILICLDCEYTHTAVPECVIKAHLEDMHRRRKEMLILNGFMEAE